jgi:hypothetical protein
MRFSSWRSEGAVFTDRGRAFPNSQVEASNSVQRHSPFFVLYLLTLFLNAALMFIIEPMDAVRSESFGRKDRPGPKVVYLFKRLSTEDRHRNRGCPPIIGNGAESAI